ncbi:hypothetical protein FACS1894188_04210 [Clostridia bacterium]|nr:hypothetical protein FACS1894188_04210 [Clostridia bacterium]
MKKEEPKSVKKPGFYVALYLCVAAVLILGGVLAYTGKKPAKTQVPLAQTQTQKPAAQETNNSTLGAGSYLKPNDDLSKLGIPKPKEEEPPAAPSTEDAPTANEPKPKPPAPPAPKSTPPVSSEPAFSPFAQGDTMSWPANGDVVQTFSPEHAIYDVTLEQYRTNDNICISAPVGTQVKAAAAGRVSEIGRSSELGNTVVIDHGNGWTTTYSQLQDNVLVAVGDVVKSGQVIGGVGKPSIYSVLLGDHLNFKVSRDDSAVDPNTLLAEK